jgi:O-antigen ligase
MGVAPHDAAPLMGTAEAEAFPGSAGRSPVGAAEGPQAAVARGERTARLAALCQELIVGLLMALILVLPMARARWTRSALLVGAAALWIGRWLLGARPLWRRTALDRPIAAFAVWALLSALTSLRPQYSLEKFGQEVLASFGLYYLVLVHVRSERDHRRLLGALSAGVLIMAGYGLWEWSRPWHIAGNYIRSLTAGGTYIGAYLAAVIPVAAAQTAVGGMARRGWWWLISGVGLLCVVPTQSRAAWAGVGIALVFLAAAVVRWLWLPLAAVTAAAPLVFGSEVFRRFLLLVSPHHMLADVGTMDRVPVWAYAVRRMGDHPVLGFGFGRQVPGVVMSEGYRSGELMVQGGPLGYAHNTFLDIGLQMGAVGLVLFVWLVGAVIVALWRAWRAAPSGYPRMVAAGVLAMALAYPARAMTNNYYADDPAILFWFLVALAFAAVAGSLLPVPGSEARATEIGRDQPGTGNREPGTPERSGA